ncbi:MAG: hypothetical protein FWG77_10655 [Treponema sp.]|nr:hypothetical protein [Treponema sp.]
MMILLTAMTIQPIEAMSNGEAGALFLHRDSILRSSDILAFYGHPRSRTMGILGRHPKEELYRMLTELAEEYEAAGGRKVVKAFYIIYGTVWPEGEIGYIGDDLLTEWIEFALEHDMLVFIDHQIGRFTPEIGIRRMLHWMRYPNVHLALDPEWRTSRPLLELGHVTAAELNNVQQIMQDYLIDNNIPGERFLVVHQFNHIMLRNRQDIRGDFDRVRFVHHISGIGTPEMKRDTYAFGALASNIPVKGFKLWFDFGIAGHTDIPLMTPDEVMTLYPRPYIIMYQ